MKQLDPRAVWLFFLSFLMRWAFVVIVFGFYLSMTSFGLFVTGAGGDFHGFWGYIGVVWFALSAFVVFLSYIWAKLTYHYYRYELTEEGFRKEYGVIYKKYVTIPYDRIQNVDIYRGILARLLGLSDLNIQTAGASGVQMSEGRLPALSKEAAEELRNELVRRIRGSRGGI